jgi:transcription elongation factor Elf1
MNTTDFLNKGTFCCGYCGYPTDCEGNPLATIPEGFDNAVAENVHGNCCAAQVQHENEGRIVTREMAVDAGMPDIEGMQY